MLSWGSRSYSRAQVGLWRRAGLSECALMVPVEQTATGSRCSPLEQADGERWTGSDCGVQSQKRPRNQLTPAFILNKTQGKAETRCECWTNGRLDRLPQPPIFGPLHLTSDLHKRRRLPVHRPATIILHFLSDRVGRRAIPSLLHIRHRRAIRARRLTRIAASVGGSERG